MAEPAKKKSLAELMVESKAQLQAALPKHLSVDRFLRIVMTEVRRNPELQRCSAASILKCMIQSAQLGLEPDSLRGHAYLVPFAGECTLIPGYRGLIDLAYRSGKIELVDATLVYDCDTFKMIKGDSPSLLHEPMFPRPETAKRIGAYCVIFPREGKALFDAMDVTELEKIRDRSVAYKRGKGPWITDPGEMEKKSITRRTLKYAPSSPDVQGVITYDELSEQGLLPEDVIDVTDLTQHRTEQTTEELKAKYGPDVSIGEGERGDGDSDSPGADDQDQTDTGNEDPANTG